MYFAVLYCYHRLLFYVLCLKGGHRLLWGRQGTRKRTSRERREARDGHLQRHLHFNNRWDPNPQMYEIHNLDGIWYVLLITAAAWLSQLTHCPTSENIRNIQGRCKRETAMQNDRYSICLASSWVSQNGTTSALLVLSTVLKGGAPLTHAQTSVLTHTPNFHTWSRLGP